MKIDKIFAYWVLDSRGKPTVACKSFCGEYSAIAMVPSGASTGSREALELRDHDAKFFGYGVEKAVKNVNEILAPLVLNHDLLHLQKIDQAMISEDGTQNKSNLGANAILAVSLSLAKLGALVSKKSLYEYLGELYGFEPDDRLPTPFMNIVNGGSHAKNGLDFQEFMIVPNGAHTFSDAVRMGAEIYMTLGKMLKSSGVGDEGGYSPTNFNSEKGQDRVVEILETLVYAITDSGYVPGKDVSLAMDVAASVFYNNNQYILKGNQILNSVQLINFYGELVNKYPLIAIEDGLSEDDYPGWIELNGQLGAKIAIVGDDLFTTNTKELQKGIREKSANAVIVKVNQIGTLTETVNFIKLAKENQFKTIISNRSGETEDTTIADLAMAFNAGYIKTGSLARSERTAKYNRLLEIEQELGSKAKYGVK